VTDNKIGFEPIRPGLPKLVATDLDGTIVRSDDSVSARTHAAFERVRAMGIPVVGVTGRGPRLIDLCRRDLPQADYFVFGQGARVVDLTGPGEPVTLFADVMDGGLVSDVLATIEATAGPLSVLVEPLDTLDTNLHGDPNPAWRFADAVVPRTRADALAGQVIKAFAHSEAYTADELLAIAQGVVGPEIVEMTQAGLGYIEICPRGVTKASGLAVVAGHLGVDADDILVFGDMPNDLSMFGYAGWARVAVANAHPALLAIADQVAGACDDDGVAVYLERLLDGPAMSQ
jgi:Cof subfamily protein (haloacid dehalogenase superfamily)